MFASWQAPPQIYETPRNITAVFAEEDPPLSSVWEWRSEACQVGRSAPDGVMGAHVFILSLFAFRRVLSFCLCLLVRQTTAAVARYAGDWAVPQLLSFAGPLTIRSQEHPLQHPDSIARQRITDVAYGNEQNVARPSVPGQTVIYYICNHEALACRMKPFREMNNLTMVQALQRLRHKFSAASPRHTPTSFPVSILCD